MRELLKHLWNNNREEILNRSLLHCHIKGMHSIMLLESPGKTIRLYISEPNTNLIKAEGNKHPLAIHGHHCNLTLEVVKGLLYNYRYKLCDPREGDLIMMWNYQSKILTGKMRFKECVKHYLRLDHIDVLTYKMTTSMLANELHTVSVLEDDYTAWLVYEGLEDKEYDSYCYTNLNPNNSIDDLYIKPTEMEIKLLLELTFDIVL